VCVCVNVFYLIFALCSEANSGP